LISEKEHFHGTIDLKYRYKWHKVHRWGGLLETATRIWKDGYALKKGEKVNVSFVLVPAKKNMELPLEDYLDSYSIALAMGAAAKKFKVKVGLGSCTDRFSQLARSVRTADLMATLRGCELDKEVDEEVFKRFKELSKVLKINRFEFSDAAFGIHGKGYFGKHFFGENIGYPSLNKKTRWSSPGQIMLKDPYSPQTKHETRDPMMRYAITETLPIDIFIETCNINYNKLRKKSDGVRNVFNRCEWIRVVGKQVDGYKTDFKVWLRKKDGERKYFISSDCDVSSKIDQEYFKRTGIKAGSFANFPSGEAFVTPARVEGVMVGDVVINIDQSYVISPNKPVVVSFDRKKGYKIVNAPAKLKKEMKKQLDEGRERIRNYEKNKSLPKEVIDIYKKNFKKVGEFAVNTNPKAKLCDYLIVNEKIARMIHVALGLGFEPDRKTVYHWDIVVNSPRQKLDIYGVDKKNKVHWVIKKGNLIV
jgi:leucyl aminopeptidase (aminopeptidase T)